MIKLLRVVLLEIEIVVLQFELAAVPQVADVAFHAAARA
jgi:hypothetical protein